jgi:formate hydrogenlyase subunit 6/NADH:ubiquinone oxidoreductase subunit I
VITEPCLGTKDRSCVDVCPVDCINKLWFEDKAAARARVEEVLASRGG